MKKIALLLTFCFFIQTGFSQGNSVGSADQFCSGGAGLVFPNVTGNPNATDVGCLFSIPNPSYYFLQVEQPGDLDFTISQETAGGLGLDVDFIAWGPFVSQAAATAAITLTPCTPTACPNNTANPGFYPYAPDNITDCSFDIAPTEDMTIMGGLSGQIYVVLITNFSDQPGFITFQQTGGTGSTNCATIPVCGGNFYDTGGDAGSYSNNETTTTTIYPDTIGGTVTIDFTAFNVLSGDVLTVYNGPDATYPSLGTVASAAASFSSTDATGALTFVFTSDASGVSTGWETDVTCSTPPLPPTCGSKFYDVGGSTSDYLNNETTTTTIYPTVAGGTVTVDFITFNVLAGDVLTIYDGPDATYPVLNIVTTAPSSFSSTNASGELTFVFTSNTSGFSSGWDADVSCTTPPTCSSFFFDSGGPTGDYSDNELTTTTFFPDTGGDAVTVTFTLFDLEFADDLYVYNGPTAASPLLGVFNGTGIPGPFTSSDPTGALTFVFESDFSEVYEGWEASLSCAPYVPPIICGSTFTDSGGAGGNYSDNELSTTTLTPDIAGTAITATFTFFNTESCCDELSIYDGPDATYPLLGTYAGTTLPPALTSSDPSGALTFVFESDFLITSGGWAADITCISVEPTCGDMFYDSGGASGNYGSNESETTIITPIIAGDAVTTTFSAFNLDAGDSLEVFDGATSLGTFTGTIIPGPFTATDPSGELTFVFTSDGSGTQSGWAADITCSILCVLNITDTVYPIGAIVCNLVYSELSATASAGSPGGTTEIFSDDFSGGISGWTALNETTGTQWISSATSNAGGTASEAVLDWITGFDSGTWTLTSNPIDINTHTGLQLELSHAFDWFSSTYPHSIYIETSTDNIMWDTHYSVNPVNADVAAEALSLDISAQDNNPTLYVRFRFTGETFGMNSWSIDDVVITGDAPAITPTITWSPQIGLYTDSGLTTAYLGEDLATVYADPISTQTYIATENPSLCTDTVIVVRAGNRWTSTGPGADSDWNRAANWSFGTVPTNGEHVIIPDVTTTSGRFPVILGGAPIPPAVSRAGCLTIEYNGFIEVGNGGRLIITDNITIEENDPALLPDGKLLIRSGGNLIQITDGAENTNNNSGNIKMQRSVTGVAPDSYVYWSSPVEGFEVQDVSPLTSGFIYEWDPTTSVAMPYGNWISPTPTVMAQGKGYIIKDILGTTPEGGTFVPIPKTSEFIGVPRNGELTTTISRGDWGPADGTSSDGTYNGAGNTIATHNDDNWNLIGNPYPSSIWANDFIDENAGVIEVESGPVVFGTIWLWVHQNTTSLINDPFYGDYVYNYGNQYTAYNKSGSNPAGFDGYIASGQAFFVLMDDTTPNTADIRFRNSMRYFTVSGDEDSYDNNQFLRTNSNESSTNNGIERHRIWLDLIKPNNNAMSILVGYIEGATNAIDRLYDGYDLNRSGTRLFSLIDNNEFSIQGKTLPFDEEDIVPLGITITENGIHQIAINSIDGLFENETQGIYLEDTDTNTIHDLRLATYSFTSETGTFNDRFILKYTNNSLNVEDFNSLNGIKVFEENEKIVVKSDYAIIQSIEVYDILGRTLFYDKSININRFIINSLQPKDTTLFLKIKLVDGKQKIAKIIF